MKQRLHKEQWSFTFMIRSHQSLVYIVYVQVKEGLLGLFVRRMTVTRTEIRFSMCVVCVHMLIHTAQITTRLLTYSKRQLFLRPSLFPCVEVSPHKMWQQDLKTCQGLKWYLRGYNYTKGANSIYPVLWRDCHWGPHNGWCCLLLVWRWLGKKREH